MKHFLAKLSDTLCLRNLHTGCARKVVKVFQKGNSQKQRSIEVCNKRYFYWGICENFIQNFKQKVAKDVYRWRCTLYSSYQNAQINISFASSLCNE